MATCRVCAQSHQKRTQTCSLACLKRLQTQLFAGEKNPAYGKTYRSKSTHPDWAEKISQTHKDRGTLVGEKNPMKCEDVAQRMSKTRRERVTSDPAYRAERSRWAREAWAQGKYDGVRVGQCEWYDLTKKDGTVVKLQGTWEFAYARWMDENGITFRAHAGRVPYVDSDGNERSYYPDFLLEDGSYVDTKNPYYVVEHAEKLELVRRANPGIRITVIDKGKMEELGLLESNSQGKMS